jgi:hypothetical protein
MVLISEKESFRKKLNKNKLNLVYQVNMKLLHILKLLNLDSLVKDKYKLINAK